MGLYNGKPDLITNRNLKDNICPICTSRGFTESHDNKFRDTFDYVCPICNPAAVIGITEAALSSPLLEELSKSQRRFELRTEIQNWKENFYLVQMKTLNHFLGTVYQENLPDYTFDRWMKGELTGLPRLYEKISSDDLRRINEEQQKVFDEKVSERLENLISKFKSKMAKSLDKAQLLEKEIESINYFLKTDDQPHKGAENDVMTMGTIRLPLYMIRGIREQYRNAVNGELDINNVLSPNQIINVGSGRTLERCMVDAVAYQKYVGFLESQGEQEDQGDDEEDGTYFTASELRDLHGKIETLLDEISQMKFELQTGQEVLYNEINDLRTLPALKKKTWVEIIRGKLFTLLLNKVITVELFHRIYRELTGSDIKLLGE